MDVLKKEQIALIVIVFLVAFASTIGRAFRDGNRRGMLRLFGLGCTSGFLGVGLFCVGSPYSDRLVGTSGNLLWIGIASLIGFTAKYQDKIGGDVFIAMVNKALGGAVVTLQTIQSLTTKKPDEPDEKK